MEEKRREAGVRVRSRARANTLKAAEEVEYKRVYKPRVRSARDCCPLRVSDAMLAEMLFFQIRSH